MARDRSDAAIVRSTITLAHELGLEMVAEGVEDAQTLALLGELGCDSAQGFHIARPTPAAELVEWLRSSGYGYRALGPGAGEQADIGAALLRRERLRRTG